MLYVVIYYEGNYFHAQFSHYSHQLMVQFSSFDSRNYSVPCERASL